jgi:hypothetical protein
MRGMICVKNLIPFLFIVFFLNFINCLAKNNCCDSNQCSGDFLCLDCICQCGDGYIETNKSCVRKQLHCMQDSDCGNDGKAICNSNKCQCNENHKWDDEHKCSKNSSVGRFQNNTIIKELFVESIEYVIIIGIVLILVLMACIYRIIVAVLKRKKKSMDIEMSRSDVIKV